MTLPPMASVTHMKSQRETNELERSGHVIVSEGHRGNERARAAADAARTVGVRRSADES